MRSILIRLAKLAGELKRRRVLPVTGIYIVAAWGLLQGAAELLPVFGASEWTIKAMVMVAFALLPIVIVLAWRFDITTDGIVRDMAPNRISSRSELVANSTTIAKGHPEHGSLVVSWDDDGHIRKELFTNDFVLGRGENCDIRFWDTSVSRNHAKIAWQQDRWVLTDLGSRNGTMLNGARVTTAQMPDTCKIQLTEDGPAISVKLTGKLQSAVMSSRGQTFGKA